MPMVWCLETVPSGGWGRGGFATNAALSKAFYSDPYAGEMVIDDQAN